MRNEFSALIAILTAGMLLVATATQAAQSRASPPKKHERQPEELEAAREATLAEIDIWLRRLAGRYRASADTAGESLMDCQSVGNGPGIHCIIGPSRISQKQFPSVMLLGVAPERPGVRYMQVNESSIASTGFGRLSGDTLIFPKVSCPVSINRQAQINVIRCERTMRIQAPPNGRYFSIINVFEITLKVGRAPISTVRTSSQTFNQRIDEGRKRGR